MANKLNINDTTIPTLQGLLDFDGSTFVYLDSEPDITGDKTIFFNLYLDSDVISTDLAAIVSFSHVADRSDQFMVYTVNGSNPDRIYIVPSNDSADAKWIATTGLSGKRMSWEISKSAGVVNYLKIDGVEKTLSAFDTGFLQPDVPGIGRRKLEGTNINAFADGLIWDVEIKDGSTGIGTSLYKWAGYPGGDQNSAWLDQSGTVDGSVTGIDNNVPSTRDLEGSGTSSRLELNLPSEDIGGVLNFDGSTRVDLFSGESSDIRYDKQVKFKLYLDNESGYGEEFLFRFYGVNASSDKLECVLDGSLLIFSPGVSFNTKSIFLSGLSGKELSVEINKSLIEIDSVFINGEEQTLFSKSYATGGIVGLRIGDNSNAWGEDELSNATLWDIEIYDTSTIGSPRTHYWKGYPAGNTDAAWIDQEGSYDGEVETFGGSATTRTIQGGSGAGDVLTSSRKLFVGEIVIPPETKTLYAGTSPDGSILTSEIITNSGSTPDVTFTSLGSENLGDVIGIDSYSRSGTTYIVYATDEGYFVNDTSGYNVNVTDVSITAFSGSSYFGLFIGDVSGGAYTSSDGGESWSDLEYDLGENQVNEVFSQSVRIL